MRDLESSSVSTALLVNIPTPTPPVASVPYSIPIPPLSNAHTFQVGVASQTPTNRRISTPISHPNVSAATPYSSSLPPPTIPNATLSHPSPTSSFSVESRQHRCRICIRHTHHRPLTRVIRGPRYTIPPCPWIRTQKDLVSAPRHRRLIRDIQTSRQTSHTRPERESRTSSYRYDEVQRKLSLICVYCSKARRRLRHMVRSGTKAEGSNIHFPLVLQYKPCARPRQFTNACGKGVEFGFSSRYGRCCL